MSLGSCSRCGSDLPEDARFCPRCGAPTDAGVVEERKIVSVLFVDLTDSTRLASQLDPERFREMQAAFYRDASERVGSLRGRVEKFVGDAVMAVFGLPHAHEDDALRAVRAAIEIRDGAKRLGEEMALPAALRVRVGVNSGPAVVGAGPAGQLLASGSVVTVAARLQQAAEPDEVLAGETTRQLTYEDVVFDAPRAVDAKGFPDPISAWPVGTLSRRSTRRTIPLIGRRREHDLLTQSLARTKDSSRLHLVTIIGEPGIGKSRLLEDFLSSIEQDVRVLRGRVGRFEEDALLVPLAEMIRRAIDADAAADRDEMRDRLLRSATEVCGAEDAERIASGLASLYGDAPGPGSERPHRLAEVRAALHAYLEGLARSGPVVLAFEDMEAARADLLELVEQLARRGRRSPIMIVCAGRDEMLETRPGWAGGIPDAMTLRLEPLTDEEALELALASGHSLDPTTAERVARHAGGNPFFIVETTGMLLHEAREGVAGVTGLPATVQAVVASRIDHLDPAQRDVVRKASVFARSTFHTSELEIVADASQQTLVTLEDEELLVRDPDRPGVWRFNHEVVRDVAYDSLPKRERLRLHLAVADRLAEGGRHPTSLAYHLERAAHASVDLDPRDRTLAERAVDALADAGHEARRKMELRTAIDLFERALALAGPEEEWEVREARAVCGIGEARYWLGEFANARTALERALRAAPDDGWTRSLAHRFIGDVALNFDADVDRAEEHFALALDAARALAPPDGPYAVARTLLVAGWGPYMRNDTPAARAMFEEALAVARANPEGDRWAESRALTFIARMISGMGDEAEGLPLLERALAIGRETGDRFSTAVALQAYGEALHMMGRADDALSHQTSSLQMFVDLGARWEAASVQADIGELHRMQGRPDQAEAPLRAAVDACRALGDRQQIGWIAAQHARTLRVLGRADEARRLLDEIAKVIDPLEEVGFMKAQALLALDAGDTEAAYSLLKRVLDKEQRRGLSNNAALGIWFAGRVLGTGFVGAGAMDEARKRLEAAHWIAPMNDPDLR